MARCAYLVARPRIEGRARANLEYAFGDNLSKRERGKLVRRAFRLQAVCLFEAMALSRDAALVRSRVANWDETKAVFEQALSHGRGVVLLAGHVGSWEIVSQVLPTQFEMLSVARRLESERINRLVLKIRERTGGAIAYHDGSPRALLGALKANGIVGIVADHAFRGVSAMEVPFFGHPTRMPVSPYLIARKTGSPVLFVSAARLADGRYQLRHSEPKFMRVSDDREADTRELLLEWVAFLESTIQDSPESWLPLIGHWKKLQAKVKAEAKAKAKQQDTVK